MVENSLRVLALRHIMVEHLGVFETRLRQAGASISYIDLARGGELPASHHGYDVLFILGGPMSVNDENKLSWLGPEKRFVREAVSARKTVVGVCLGAQMIASSLGATVAPGAEHEVGFLEIELDQAAAADPLLAHFHRPRQMVFQLHGEGFELPPGAVRLAHSARYPNQAFRLGRRCWGLQFHVETDRPMIERWVREYWGDPAALAPDSYALAMLREAPRQVAELERLAAPMALAIARAARDHRAS